MKNIIKKKNSTYSFFHIIKNNTYNLIGDIMDKDIMTTNHNINITGRKNINISGVQKIENFDESEFLLETNMGYLKITGTNLEIIKLDTYQGDVSIKGKINSFNYIEEGKKQEKQESVLSKLFK